MKNKQLILSIIDEYNRLSLNQVEYIDNKDEIIVYDPDSDSFGQKDVIISLWAVSNFMFKYSKELKKTVLLIY